jgi:predicted O-linked N-acetylglucosamine transferase (SPINDLY family)
VYAGERLKFDVNDLASSNCHPPVELAYQGRDDLSLRKSLAQIFEDSLPSPAPIKGSGKPSLAFFVPKGSEGIFLRGMSGVLTRLSPERFRTTVVCSPRGIATIKAALADSPIDYFPLSPTLGETINKVRAERFDLAYFWEVATDSMSYFLPFFRLAAAQCTSWGWPVSSGIAEMDYFISSDLLEPDDGESHYSERLIRLKHIPNYYPRPTWPVPRADRDRFDLQPEQHVYVCAQNPWKIQPDFDFLAGEILRRDPRGVLLLVEARWPYVTAAIGERFCRSFPDCADRIRFVPRMIQADYLTLLATADVALDTVHYSGGANSVYDALSVGTPVVTLPTALHRGRYTLAAYRTMGMTACVAKSPVEYVELAVRLATDSDHRRSVSNEIAATRGALFDNLAAVRELEDLFEDLALQGRRGV